MQTYKHLLNNSNWQARRREIIEASNFKCANCKNTIYTETSIRGRLISIEKTNKYFISPKAGFNYTFNVNFKSPDGVDLFSTISTFKNLDILDLKKAIILYSFKDAIIVNAIKLNAKWLFVRNLHVHHTYYQENKLPWEYPDIALKVVCWSCHEDLHKKETINWLDVNGNVKRKLNPCPRCYGAGWFPEFSHVENGICFECTGAKYIQLINR